MNLSIPTFISFLRSKNIIIYLLSISIILAFLITIVNCKDIIDSIYKSEIENNIKNRTLYVSNNDGQEIDLSKLKNLDNILDVNYVISPFVVLTEDNTSLNIKPINIEQKLKIINGQTLSDKYNDKKIEIIISNKIDDEISLDKEINIKYQGLILKAKIIGIYDDIENNKYSYISNQAIKVFIDYDYHLLNKNACLVEVNQYDNVENLINYLNNNGYSANIYDTSGIIDINTYTLISKILLIFIFLVFLLIYVLISIIINNIIHDEKKDLSILKAIGYNNKHIFFIIFNRLLLITIFSYIIGVVFSVFLQALFSYILQKILSINIEYNINTLTSAIILLTLIILVYITSIINKNKIKKIDPIILLKD